MLEIHCNENAWNQNSTFDLRWALSTTYLHIRNGAFSNWKLWSCLTAQQKKTAHLNLNSTNAVQCTSGPSFLLDRQGLKMCKERILISVLLRIYTNTLLGELLAKKYFVSLNICPLWGFYSIRFWVFPVSTLTTFPCTLGFNTRLIPCLFTTGLLLISKYHAYI